MTTPTPEVNLVVELNSDVLKTLHDLQAEMKSFKEDSLNERKEHRAINEALLRNMTGWSPQGKPTQSINRSKREPYHEWASIPREAKKEGTLEATKGDHHIPVSDDSLYLQKKMQRSDDSREGEFLTIRASTYEGEVNKGEKVEEWLVGISKYFQVL